MRSFLPLCKYSGALLWSSLFIMAAAIAAPAQPPAAEDSAPSPIALSPFEVKAESMKFLKWSKISSPHFVVYTDARAKDTALLVRQMEMMHQATQFFLRRQAMNLPPLIIVLPTARSDWRKLASKGGVEWEVAGSLLGSTRPVLLIQHDWQADGLSSVWTLIANHHLEAMNLRGPLWFNRGVGSFFSTVAFGPDTITLGKETIYGALIKQYGWMNWGRFFAITSNSPEFTSDSDDHTRYEAQCRIFAHFVLTNADQAWTPRMLTWANYLAADHEPTEEKFKVLFQKDWAGVQQLLVDMLRGGAYTTGNIRFPPAALQFETATAAVSDKEMRELFVLCQTMNQKTKDSEASLDALLQHGLKTAWLRELLADACDERGRHDVAVREYRALAEAGSANPEVYASAAHILFDEVVPKFSLDARLGEREAEIRKRCQQALALEPRYAAAAELLAWTEAFGATVEKENTETIVRICRNLDGVARTDRALAALAVARWRSGNAKQARSLAERIIASDMSGKVARDLAQEIITRLDAAAKIPAATTPTSNASS